MAKSYTNKCTKCGAEFITQWPQTKYCPKCTDPRVAYNREYRKTHKDTRVRNRKHKRTYNYAKPSTECLTMAQIRARARRVHVEAGWRGQRCMGGGSVSRMPMGVAQ